MCRAPPKRLAQVRFAMRLLANINLVLVFLTALGFGQKNYSTTFNYAENPISNGGAWVNGHLAGTDNCHWGFTYCWGNIQTNGRIAYGTDEPTKYGDPTAILTGTWGPDQTVLGTLHIIAAQPTGINQCCHEIELRLRTTIRKGSITGYEVYCSLISSDAYCHIARWGGPKGAYLNLDACAGDTPAKYLKEGDVLKATVRGTNPVTLTAFINQTQVMRVQDTGSCTFSDGKKYGPWMSGNPGIGQYDTDGSFNSFGWSHFSATDTGQ
jgi:hypothetical protein